MRLKENFEIFLRDAVNLDQTRLGRVQSAHNTIRDKLRGLDDVKPYFVGTYLQGSYALKTAIRPCDENSEYDVDVVLALVLMDDNGELYDGNTILDWLYRQVEEIPLYKGKVERRERCIRVRYESDGQRFHLDVLPAHQPIIDDDPILIPPDWAASNPRGYINWLNERRKNRCAHVRHITRLLKYWRNLQFPDGVFAPNSMVLTTLVGQHVPLDKHYSSLDEALVKTMKSINDWLQGLDGFEEVVVNNPSLDGENLARNWNWVEVSTFRGVFSDAAVLAELAWNSKGEEETIDLWNDKKHFDDRFPKTVRGLDDEAKAVSQALENGGLQIGATGLLNMGLSSSGVRARRNSGFYGREGREA